ncbi:MAG TPA: DsbA family protein [Steroidobacteraceae bacterium]|nr:DsbA family protein [Steroidobacteraceae bacterium]
MIVDWYFDFVSPFAYLQFLRLPARPADTQIQFHPVLLAAVLNHWGQLGPAEIPPKRTFTYRHFVWRVRRAGLALRMPAGHPFNSLKLLRLALAADCEPEIIGRLFRFAWQDGHLPDDEQAWTRLVAEPALAKAAARIEDPDVKEALRRNTEQAIERSVFGVPTAVADGQIFWGEDSTEMLFDYLRDPGLFDDAEMRRVTALPISAARVPRRK